MLGSLTRLFRARSCGCVQCMRDHVQCVTRFTSRARKVRILVADVTASARQQEIYALAPLAACARLLSRAACGNDTAALLRCCCYCREIRSHIRAAAIARKLQQRGHNLVRLVLERLNASSMRSRLCRLNGDRQTLMACCEQSMI